MNHLKIKIAKVPLLYVTILLLLSSCTYNNKKKIPWDIEYQMFKDSLTRADSLFKDSLKTIIGDEALGQIKFGMNKKQFELAKKALLDSVKGPLNDYYIEDTEFYIIRPQFNKQGKLCQIIVVTTGMYELSNPKDIYNTSAFVEYLRSKYGLSKDDKKEEWIIGDTHFVRRPSNLSYDTKLVKNTNSSENRDDNSKHITKTVVYCSIDLVITNFKYKD